MKLYTGVDSVEIARVEKAIARDSFFKGVYTPEEQQRLGKMKHPAPTAAGYFAAKEAFAKALGTGFRGFRPHEGGGVVDELGAPRLVPTGRAAQLCGGKKFSLSITHTASTATAFVVAWEEE